ncbi:MAG: hypothetical protein JXN61_08560 [Sedimentisphaerales bacterium]|nr:hypothetical protein [Sedimentisphaerales bacterium]
MIRYYVPSASSDLELERTCPHCSRPNGRIHSAIISRAISDPKMVRKVMIMLLRILLGAKHEQQHQIASLASIIEHSKS